MSTANRVCREAQPQSGSAGGLETFPPQIREQVLERVFQQVLEPERVKVCEPERMRVREQERVRVREPEPVRVREPERERVPPQRRGVSGYAVPNCQRVNWLCDLVA